jgi:hypothetical protein
MVAPEAILREDRRMGPTADDFRIITDDLTGRFAELPDDAWGRPALELEWDCRETAAHLMDDFAFYAMQLSGRQPPQDDYVALVDPPPWQSGGPEILFWPDPATGTAGIVSCFDAAAGLLYAVTATAPAGHRGYHPAGASDASGFAAMGVAEAVLHGFDILAAHGIGYRPDDVVIGRVLDRIFPAAERTDDPWQDLLRASGRTPETRGQKWRWDSSVRG